MWGHLMERCSNQSPLQQPLHHYPHNQSQNHRGWETTLQAFLIPFYRQGKGGARTCPGPQSPSAAEPRPEDSSPKAMCFSHLNSVFYPLLLGRRAVAASFQEEPPFFRQLLIALLLGITIISTISYLYAMYR